jgi:hypothetical protein
MVAMIAAKILVAQIVKSTVTWANNGFEGNPAYVTDYEGYFTNLADGIAGDLIGGTKKLGFLCSPFQNSIRISLATQYYQSSEQVFQCRISGIKGNIENFYQDFSNGGWQAWFSMTQNDASNQAGAYLVAKAELDASISQALGREKTKLDWGQGFKSKGDCLVRNGTGLNLLPNPTPEQTLADKYNPAYPPGDCILSGPDKTPGTVIKAQLDKVLPSGLEKLITVNHVEQLVGAFASGLLQRYVFSSKGLFSNQYNDHFNVSDDGSVKPTAPSLPQASPTTPSTSSGGVEQVSCIASKTSAIIGESVSWISQQNLGFNPTYAWSGEELSGAGPSASVKYSTIGAKNAQLSVSVTDSNGTLHSATKACSNSVIVTDPNTTAENE